MSKGWGRGNYRVPGSWPGASQTPPGVRAAGTKQLAKSNLISQVWRATKVVVCRGTQYLVTAGGHFHPKL